MDRSPVAGLVFISAFLVSVLIRSDACGAVGVGSLARRTCGAGCCTFVLGDLISRTQDTEGTLIIIRESARYTWHAFGRLPIVSLTLGASG